MSTIGTFQINLRSQNLEAPDKNVRPCDSCKVLRRKVRLRMNILLIYCQCCLTCSFEVRDRRAKSYMFSLLKDEKGLHVLEIH